MLSKIQCEQTPSNPNFFQSQSRSFKQSKQFQQENSNLFMEKEERSSKSNFQDQSDQNELCEQQILPFENQSQVIEGTHSSRSSRQNTIKQNYKTWKKGMSKNKNMEKNLAFIGKIMFCILAFAVLIGILAAKIEQTIQEEPKGRPLNKDDSEVLNRLYKTKYQVVTKIEDLKPDFIEVNDDNSLRKLSLQKNLQKQEVNTKSDASSEIQNETTNIQVKKIAKNGISISETSANDKVLSENIGIQTKQISENKKENQEQSLTGKLKINIIQKFADLQNQKKSPKNIQQNSLIQPLPQQNENKQNPKVAQQNPSIQPLAQQNSKNNHQFNQIQVESSKSQVLTFEESCNIFIRQQNKKYGGLYQFSVNRNILRTNSHVDFFIQRVPTKVTKDKYVEAVSLLQTIHHVDPSGKIIAEDTPCDSAEATIKRLNETIQQQNQRLNETYQIDSYFNNQLRFCIVTNSYKNAQNGLIYRNLDSILQQNYTNYHVVYTDDKSPDNTGEIVKKYLAEKNVSEDKIKVKINQQKLGMMENIYNAITYDCELGEIAVMLDGDDSLIGTHVLSFLNAVYQKRKLALMWNNFLQINDNSRAMMGFSKDLQNFQNNYQAYRRSHIFASSHLKSFYVDLFRKIKQSDLQQEDGKFFGGASDTAMMTTMLEMAHPRFQYVPEIVYEYRFDTGQVGMLVNRAAQSIALTKIGMTEPYYPLKDFSFIDEAILKTKKQD